MRGLRILILACATVSAVLAMWLMKSTINSQAALPAPQQQAAAAQPVDAAPAAPVTSQVLVANREIPTGRVMGPEDMRWQAWPSEAVSESFYTEGEDVAAIETLTGSASRLTIVEGEPITSNKIVDLNGTGVLAALLRPGMRAISIPISEITGAGGFILPGDFVDILLTRQLQVEEIDEETGEVVKTSAFNQTETIMKTVRVLAIDQQLNETERAATVGNSATLELMPEQAELITLTRQIAQQERGFLTLSLRSFKEMVDEYGDEIDKVLPRTMIDLAALAKEKIQTASKSQATRAEYLARQKAKAKADCEKFGCDEDPSNANEAAVATLGGAEAAVPEKKESSTVTLIRNGSPIVVHTIKPNSAGTK